eukprot:GILK01011274.1.p1 GENE.GILK01011274.1~~GILK01011274.1.p1  ORF type:complete len:713 (+),score=125.19 GILK01011274.1:183-2321(+)
MEKFVKLPPVVDEDDWCLLGRSGETETTPSHIPSAVQAMDCHIVSVDNEPPHHAPTMLSVCTEDPIAQKPECTGASTPSVSLTAPIPPASAQEAATSDFSLVRLKALCTVMRSKLDIRDRRWRFTVYRKCFVAADAIAWMRAEGLAETVAEAVSVGEQMCESKLIRCLLDNKPFGCNSRFYRFTVDDGADTPPDSPPPLQTQTRTVPEGANGPASHIRQVNNIKSYTEGATSTHDNPNDYYNLLVIGWTSRAVDVARRAAIKGLRVALIHSGNNTSGRNSLDSDWSISEELVKCANDLHRLRHDPPCGIRFGGEPTCDLTAIMERLRQRQMQMLKQQDPSYLSNQLGIDVMVGSYRFNGPNSLAINGKILNFGKACVATGSSLIQPCITGLQHCKYYTVESIIKLTHLPSQMLILGGDKAECELAQAFQRFGCQVTMLIQDNQLLPDETEDVSCIVQQSLQQDGVIVKFVTSVVGITQKHSLIPKTDFNSAPHTPVQSRISVQVTNSLGEETIESDCLIVGMTRVTNQLSPDLSLEAADVLVKSGRIIVNQFLQSTNPNIYAIAGQLDCPRIVIQNAFFQDCQMVTKSAAPRCVFTDPAVAHVGVITENVKEIAIQFSDVATVSTTKSTGFLRVFHKENSDEIVAVDVVGRCALELISELALAVQSKTGIRQLATVFHPSATVSAAIKLCADAYDQRMNRLRKRDQVKQTTS